MRVLVRVFMGVLVLNLVIGSAVTPALAAVHVLIVVLIGLGADGQGHLRADCRYAILVDLAHREVESHAQALKLGNKRIVIHAEIEQQPQEHVSGDA